MFSPPDVLHGKILIVDDQQFNITLLERMLRGAGYDSIMSTTDPTMACMLHAENQFDLILLDLQMPGMDGFEVMEHLKEIETDGYIPVLVITAQPEHKLRALNAGAKDFIGKPFNLPEVLIRVHNMLEVRLLHLETKRLYEQVVAEQKVSERLLLNVLPESIAERLKGRPIIADDDFTEVIADTFADVTVLFADIVEFTRFSEGVSVEVLLSVLNDVFSRFDRIADDRGLEKIKTIGDSYMVAAGLPIAVPDHAIRGANMALDMIDAMNHFNEHSRHKLNVRIGIDSGAVVAGIIGKRKFLYDLWGNVVNTASRMESHGVPGRIQITDATRQRLGAPFRFEARGLIDVKGKGEVNTWFLTGRDGDARASRTLKKTGPQPVAAMVSLSG
ncbi:MAG: adenylate/guanylate cyclase domain-containing protein [Betaproteobacteria bacterium]